MKKCPCFFLLAIAAIFTSCDHKELCDNHGHMTDVEVNFNWDLCPDADPKTMVAQIFKIDGTGYQRYEFTDKNGGKIRVDAGEYRIISHNGEMATVDEDGMLWDEYYLSCIPEELLSPMGRDGDAPRPPAADGQPIVSAPNKVWTATQEYLKVEPFVQGQKTVLQPQEITIDCSVLIENVENWDPDIKISAALSGLSGRYNITLASHCGEPVTVPIALTHEGSEGSDRLSAKFKLFGHCPESEVKHILTVYTSDKHYYNFDVTDQIHSGEDANNIIIKIDHFKLPEPSSGTDITPSISDWEEIEEIIIGMH